MDQSNNCKASEMNCPNHERLFIIGETNDKWMAIPCAILMLVAIPFRTYHIRSVGELERINDRKDARLSLLRQTHTKSSSFPSQGKWKLMSIFLFLHNHLLNLFYLQNGKCGWVENKWKLSEKKEGNITDRVTK